MEPTTPPRIRAPVNAPPPILRRAVLPSNRRRVGAIAHLEHPDFLVQPPPVLNRNFPNNNPANLNVLNVNQNAVNSMLFEPLESGNIMYRTSGNPTTTNLDHYVKIRNASGVTTNIRKYMKNTRRNPHTRENINFANRSRLRRVRKAGAATAAATLKRKRNNTNQVNNTNRVKRSRNNK